MAVNEFQALDGVDPNEIYSGDEEPNGNGDKRDTEVNFDSTGSDLKNDGTFPKLPALPAHPSHEDINTTDPESFTMLKSKERSPASALSIASIVSATKNTIATLVGMHAKVNAVAQPVIESSIDDKRTARKPSQQISKGNDSDSNSNTEITDGGKSSEAEKAKELAEW